jgi:uncharacterized membrane protein YkoI
MTNTPSTTATASPNRTPWWIAGIGIGLSLVLATAALVVSLVAAFDNDDRVSQLSQSTEPNASNGIAVIPENTPISDAERASASAAALAQVGAGVVTDVDRSDDVDHAWEVEVTFADGRDVDVELDRNFVVVRVDEDS